MAAVIGISNVSIDSSGISFKLVFLVDSGAMSESFWVKGRKESLLLQLPFCHGLNRVIWSYDSLNCNSHSHSGLKISWTASCGLHEKSCQQKWDNLKPTTWTWTFERLITLGPLTFPQSVVTKNHPFSAFLSRTKSRFSVQKVFFFSKIRPENDNDPKIAKICPDNDNDLKMQIPTSRSCNLAFNFTWTANFCVNSRNKQWN